ncbi:LOW QUALITY PROTEIN: hypothetical protein HID58_002372 [Brassica napus]|uniref:Uncharacterized protein n=1 Tax=Brassica napus TaxID=3708 RepID=A0ABQ8EMB1_BRANA|nr:LOW QUALITY PROTEIN: hypothetical protein HID58_002372 [Brassica napus]
MVLTCFVLAIFTVKQSTLHQNKKRTPRWESTEVPIPTMPEQDNYNKEEIDDLIYRAIRTSDHYHSKRLDDIYYPFDNSISWLTTRTDEIKQDMTILQKQHACRFLDHTLGRCATGDGYDSETIGFSSRTVTIDQQKDSTIDRQRLCSTTKQAGYREVIT